MLRSRLILVNTIRVETGVLRLRIVDKLGVGEALLVGDDGIGLYLLLQAFEVG